MFVCSGRSNHVVDCVDHEKDRSVGVDVEQINSHAGGEQQQEMTDPGNNQFLHHRQNRPVEEKEK